MINLPDESEIMTNYTEGDNKKVSRKAWEPRTSSCYLISGLVLLLDSPWPLCDFLAPAADKPRSSHSHSAPFLHML